ncbi:hypothetical protein SLNWT_6691 [Streptomyces albus]|uniref:Uncharacterized protein n=1 Tax=Streptomyces albus (strain ATCC 21838 / DSM 41398 / FERM P-419 / JCM 4703 / NBRC 107858) TaxID=1081613 RepID=A0A0B5F9B1_STRA4|nr:hypothetical protein SLNWT_6691 [Streptomyces albus]AOU81371.1 hypothetical protein SLNHY_6680 [Streptomyces albus]AYN37063.1 hypothetical protein DUI70_6573 [Streptomyces albus]
MQSPHPRGRPRPFTGGRREGTGGHGGLLSSARWRAALLDPGTP